MDTRAGNPIANEQSLPPDQQTLRIYGKLLEDHAQWVERKGCCGVYNCFGHVWASRRTSIYSSEDVWRIFAEDGYKRVDIEDAWRGDVAVYLHENSNKIWHAGVIEPRELSGIEDSSVPWVLSKLNDVHGEVHHHIRDVHAVFPFDIQVWTDRP